MITGHQGLTLLHCYAQPEPFLSRNSTIVSHETCGDLNGDVITRESAIYMAASQYRVGHVSAQSDGYLSVGQSVI